MSGAGRSGLTADCASCQGLCCVAPVYVRSSEFAIDKPAGTPCPNLRGDSRCSIHAELRPRGFSGCTVYDCFGAGQRLTRTVLAGTDWRHDGQAAQVAFAALPVVRQLHELLWYLDEALTRTPPGSDHEELQRAAERVDGLAAAAPGSLPALDVAAVRREVDPLLLAASEALRTGSPAGRGLRRADLVGAHLRRADLRRADLRGAWLLGADLRGADLRLADLIGADLRGADVRGADLSDALFLTQTQVNAAVGDGGTRLPPWAARPGHWTTAPRQPARSRS